MQIHRSAQKYRTRGGAIIRGRFAKRSLLPRGGALMFLSGCAAWDDLGSTDAVTTDAKPNFTAYPAGDLLPAPDLQHDSEPVIPDQFTGSAPEVTKPLLPSRHTGVQVAYAGNLQDLGTTGWEQKSSAAAAPIDEQDPLVDYDRLKALQLAQSDSGADRSDTGTGIAAGGGMTDLEAANQAIANPLAQATLIIIETNTIILDGDLSDDTEVTNVTILDPLIPVGLGEFGGRQWSLVNRPILPFGIGADVPVAGGGSGPTAGRSPGITFEDEYGMGDFTFFSLLTPVDDSPIKWGVGPIFRFPTATEERLR